MNKKEKEIKRHLLATMPYNKLHFLIETKALLPYIRNTVHYLSDSYSDPIARIDSWLNPTTRFIDLSFSWNRTKEGHYYWSNLSATFIKITE